MILMVHIQLDLPEDISKFVSIQKQILGAKDKKETILLLLSKLLKSEKELLKQLENSSKNV